jgi:hypothetical protein
LANWLIDPVATSLTGKVSFKRPYPRPLLSEEMRWNGFLLKAMEHVVEADRVFKMPPEKWEKEEDAFVRSMLGALSEAGFSLSD